MGSELSDDIMDKKIKSEIEKSETGNMMQVAVVLQGFPEERLSDIQADILEFTLLEIRNLWDKSIEYSSVYNDGVLTFTCANEETMAWLKETIPTLSPWEGAKLKIQLGSETAKNEVKKSMKVSVVLEEYPEEILSYNQADTLEFSLLRKRGRWDKTIQYSSVYDDGVLTFTCVNEGTKAWMEETIPTLSPWEGARLKILPASELSEIARNEAEKIFEVSVVLQGFPEEMLTDIQADILEFELLKIRDEWDTTIEYSSTYENGVLTFTCANKGTKAWLKETIPTLRPWDGARLEIQHGSELSNDAMSRKIKREIAKNEAENTIELSVVLQGSPEEMLSDIQADVLEFALMQTRDPLDNTVEYSTFYDDGMLIFTCANEETKVWLKETIPNLNLWDGAKLEIQDVSNIRTKNIKTEVVKNEEESPMQVSVTLQAYPEEMLSDIQADILEFSLMQKRNRWDKTIVYSAVYDDGVLIFTCANEVTKVWLKETIPTLTPWEGAEFKVLPEKAEGMAIN